MGRSIKDKESAKRLECLDRNLGGILRGVSFVTVCDRKTDVYDVIRKASLLHWRKNLF
jgi:hypothetical protein